MNEPQVWTLIGVFGTALFSMLTLMSTMFVRIVRVEIQSARAELTSEIRRVEGVLATRIDHVDRDVGAIIRREYPDPPAA